MIDLFVKHRNLAMFSLATIMIALGIIVWWRFPEGTITAQERVEDVCASAIYPESFDMLIHTTARSGGESGMAEYNVRFNGQAQHYVTSVDGTLLQEAIFVLSNAEQSPRRGVGSITSGHIRMFDAGEWGEWEVTNFKPDPVYATRRDDEDRPDSFCGLALEAPGSEVEFRYVGEETIDGIDTDHYYHSQSQIGYNLTHTREYWLDSDGLLRQVREIIYDPPTTSDPGTRIEHFKTYSGWGEENIITVPGTVVPAPESTPGKPSATAAPPPEHTATPRPSRTPTPPKPEPSETPAPATAWLEPDPVGVTFANGQWRHFTIRGTGLERVNLAINISNANGPTGAGAWNSPPVARYRLPVTPAGPRTSPGTQ